MGGGATLTNNREKVRYVNHKTVDAYILLDASTKDNRCNGCMALGGP